MDIKKIKNNGVLKMKKIAIITIYDNDNYGNRLQNYAVQEILKESKLGEPITIKNYSITNIKDSNFIKNFLRVLKGKYLLFKEYKKCNKQRLKAFKEFGKYINTTSKTFNFCMKEKEYDVYIVGSDQVWNPDFNRLRDFELLTFTKSKNKISFVASFAINNLPKENVEKTKQALMEFKNLSVREERGKDIIREITGREDVKVLLDPTMLLNTQKWYDVMKKPKLLEKFKEKKYILNYFLGRYSDQRRKEIERVAKENDCEIINILDKNDPFYTCGPSEFLYLEKNAFLICTDSFHSSVFAILFDTPFVVFDREDTCAKMNSRLETLLEKFKLENRLVKDEITKELLAYDCKEKNNILERERNMAKEFLKSALN